VKLEGLHSHERTLRKERYLVLDYRISTSSSPSPESPPEYMIVAVRVKRFRTFNGRARSDRSPEGPGHD